MYFFQVAESAVPDNTGGFVGFLLSASNARVAQGSGVVFCPALGLGVVGVSMLQGLPALLLMLLLFGVALWRESRRDSMEAAAAHANSAPAADAVAAADNYDAPGQKTGTAPVFAVVNPAAECTGDDGSDGGDDHGGAAGGGGSARPPALSLQEAPAALTVVRHRPDSKRLCDPYPLAFAQACLFLYSGLLKAGFGIVHCVEVGGASRLFLDANVACYRPWQWGVMPGLCLLFAMPLLIRRRCAELHRRRHNGTLTRSRRVQLSYLEGPYSAGCEHWEQVVFARRLVVALLSAFVRDPFARTASVAASCVGFAVHSAYQRPFRVASAQLADLATLTGLAVLALVNVQVEASNGAVVFGFSSTAAGVQDSQAHLAPAMAAVLPPLVALALWAGHVRKEGEGRRRLAAAAPATKRSVRDMLPKLPSAASMRNLFVERFDDEAEA